MELIHTEEYLLLINSKSKVEKNDLKICKNDNRISRYLSKESIESDTLCNDCHKILAYYPLTKEAKEIVEIPLLPNPFNFETNVEKLALKTYHIDSMETLEMPMFKSTKNAVEGFVKGYSMAKGKQFDIKDLERALIYGIEHAPTAESHTRMISNTEYRNHVLDVMVKRYTDKIAKESYPTEFIPQYKKDYRKNSDGENIGFPVHDTNVLETVVNLDGKLELVGSYK